MEFCIWIFPTILFLKFLSLNGFIIYDPLRNEIWMRFSVCVVGVPDSYRGSSQAGGAGIGAHVCAGAGWSLFHFIRCPNARWLWVWLHRQVKYQTSKRNSHLYLIGKYRHKGAAQWLWYGVCGVSRPLRPCLNLYVTEESTWDTTHAWRVFTFFLHSLPPPSCFPPTSPFCFLHKAQHFQLPLTEAFLCFCWFSVLKEIINLYLSPPSFPIVFFLSCYSSQYFLCLTF